MKAIYVGVDATNPTLILRIRSFLRAGIDLTAFTYRREKFNTDFEPDWNNVHLGMTSDRNYWARIPRLISGVRKMLRRKQDLRDAEFIYARNFDLIIVGLFAKWFSGSNAKLVYEVEDVQEVFFKKTFSGWVFRTLEKWVLKHTDLLVLMSPGFMHGYFEPVQGYKGPWFVLENKIQLQGKSKTPTESGSVWQLNKDKWVIGWFGTLRCPRSMSLLEDIATTLGDKVEIYTRGYPTETGLDEYMKIVNRHPNWIYDGEYTIPDDLEDMYGRVHFSWCLDFLDEEGNSPLLLACRMYQGGFYGAVPLVVKGWEMDRWLKRAGIGHAFEAPYAQEVIKFLESHSRQTYDADRQTIMDNREDWFLEDGRDTEAMIAQISAL